MDTLVERSLTKIRKLTGRSQRDLREACDAVLTKIASAKGPNGSMLDETDVFWPLLLAILGRQPKQASQALDCIEKLISYGYLRGAGSVSAAIAEKLPLGTKDKDSDDASAKFTLMDAVVSAICSCNDHHDEEVQLQVLKAVLQAVTSQKCDVHEHSLLKSVRACYHIHLVSKNTMNQTVAKATLQQMVNVVFQRMEMAEEAASRVAKPEPKATEEVTTARSESSNSMDKLFVASPSQAMYPDVLRCLQIEYREVLVKAQSLGLEALATEDEHKTDEPKAASSVFSSPFQKDAFLLFRSLCRISMRSLAEDAATSATSSMASTGPNQGADDPFAFQSKLVSLDLLLSILNHSGPTFRSGDKFLQLVRQYLCVSLLQNCTSNYTQIVELSLRVFVELIAHFKAHLKAEIEVFITNIFLGILESENSSLEHKLLVLEVLKQICADGSILGEIFLNYDCDWNSMDLFKRIVTAISKIAKGKKDAPGSSNAGSSANPKLKGALLPETMLVIKGLECLTATVASLKKSANFTAQDKKDKELLEARDDSDDDEATEAKPVAPVTPHQLSAVEAFDRKKKLQEELAEGILKFNLKPTDGIKFLVARGHMENTPKDVAKFIHEHNARLDKTMVGDYLGKEVQYQNGFCLKVLHEFVDVMDFKGMEIDVAIRHFLAGFRLPGESQKIDRMMEKFAERFCYHNPGVFTSADTAFILSFSIIMLQTDLHNPSVVEEKKMKKHQFLANNRGINNGDDLPADFLGGIYDRIKETPISLKEDLEAQKKILPQNGSVTSTDKQRREAYGKEREAMVKQSEAIFKRRLPAATPRNGSAKSPATAVAFQLITEQTEISYVRPMFEIVWAPLLACCSVIFETCDQMSAVALCLDSFKHAIHLSSRLNMTSERDAFVSILSKFTGLSTSNSREIKAKHLEAIKAVVAVAVKEGNHLGDAWREILQCLSHLSRLQAVAEGAGSDPHFFKQPAATPAPTAALSAAGSFKMFARTSVAASAFVGTPSPSGTTLDELLVSHAALEEENAARVNAEIDPLQVDRVFSSSVHLSNAAIQEFLLQLCVVSLTECAGVSGRVVSSRNMSQNAAPRVFSLQKLVEVADMNMHVRSRVVWAAMWKVLSRHFTTIGCDDNLSIAMYAIDSLKQLSMKFLEKDELRDFNFQRLFLTPFEIIMANAMSMEIRELVLSCVQNMILGRVRNIKSGWKTIWGVLRVAAETYDHLDGDDRIVQMGFGISKMILETHFDRVVSVFVDAIECLLAFAVCGVEETPDVAAGSSLTAMAKDAIRVLEVCLTQLATGHVIEHVHTDSPAKRTTFRSQLALRSHVLNGANEDAIRYQKEESADDLVSDAPMSPRVTPVTAVYTDSQLHTRLWWPVLTALATLSCDKRVDVRVLALETLFGSLHRHGPKLSPGLWSIVFKGVLIPLIGDVRVLEATWPQAKAGAANTGKMALLKVANLFGVYYDAIGFLPELLFALSSCMVDEVEAELACAAASTLETLLVTHGCKFPENVWGLIADELRHVMNQTQPTWVLADAPAVLSPKATAPLLFSPRSRKESYPPSFISVYPGVLQALGFKFNSLPRTEEERPATGYPSKTHLLVHLSLQQAVGHVLSTKLPSELALSDGHFASLQTSLRDSYVFARKVNDRMDVRTTLTRAGWVYPMAKPEADLKSNLLPQELNGKREYLKVLFSLLRHSPDEQVKTEARRQMVELVRRVLGEYLQWSRHNSSIPPAEDTVEVTLDEQWRSISYVPVVVDVLVALEAMNAAEWKGHLQWLYPLLVDLVRSNDKDIRNALHCVLSHKLGAFVA
ncbi:brefeldin A-inhibited guanine nucleotide-exchange protein [Achlya hypogyna]|uniref:Brefeldin A-inhibited guanine nucleotide-exchange protein n=1 Tax=Achlya hypogyna TaxID=1202772 RepID=A0A1V9ZTE7_ACHHY|nr:brefeldin A-inhibited guanine nucleotide-exchange protein [Achlya hypogyna]